MLTHVVIWIVALVAGVLVLAARRPDRVRVERSSR
jgi:hypothetical protein